MRARGAGGGEVAAKLFFGSRACIFRTGGLHVVCGGGGRGRGVVKVCLGEPLVCCVKAILILIYI